MKINNLLFQVDFWFDAFEGKADQALESKWLREKQERNEFSEYESEDDNDEDISKKLDVDRLILIKQLIFDIYRVPTGENKIQI